MYSTFTINTTKWIANTCYDGDSSKSSQITLNTKNISDTKPPKFNTDNNNNHNNYNKYLAYNINESYWGGDHKQAFSWTGISLWEENRNINLIISFAAYTWRSTAFWSPSSSAEVNFTNVTFNSTEKWNDNLQRLKDLFGTDKKFELMSETSSLLNSDNKISFNSLKSVDSNKDLITKEIQKRIKKSLGILYNPWSEYLDFNNLILTFDETKKEVKINFKDIKGNYSQKGIMPELILKVNLIFDTNINDFNSNLSNISKKDIVITSDTSINAFDDKNYGNIPTNLSNKEKVIK